MSDTIKTANEALNNGVISNYVSNGKEVLHQESDELGLRSSAHVADCETEEAARKIAVALNRPAFTYDAYAEGLRQTMLDAGGFGSAEGSTDDENDNPKFDCSTSNFEPHLMAKGIILVGGPCDGTKIAVPDDCTRKMVREETGPLSALSSMKESRSNSITWREGLYEAGNDRQVFHWQGWIG